ncbi:MAG: hypothetical protein HKN35_05225 [Woeseia sp.]|nr:hypothetical protein [Woeseia sp.]MBT8097874.1 hypothetical protein [Woeseia sp.]NNE60270.1 hypothetical protein [Woeseia sp.]NNL54294.1 hypothetical protein [Woeseia sp.]
METAAGRPLILFIPGLMPKPAPELHRSALLRCLHAGLQKADAEVARQIQADANAFDIVSWTYDFYGVHRDFSLDAPFIDELLQKDAANEADRKSAKSWRRRALRFVYRIGDGLPFLIPRLANEKLTLHLRDLRRYVQNQNDIAEHTRRLLTTPLKVAAAIDRPVLLIAHSMGSVIAFDSLWQLGRDANFESELSALITLGSPLGQRFIQRRLLGHKLPDAERYPRVIKRWINIAAVGELTAVDMTLADDFAAMSQRGLVEKISDFATYNWYREHGILNVHAEYGYLANRDVALHVAGWWRTHQK